jgi:hypothetical protein
MVLISFLVVGIGSYQKRQQASCSSNIRRKEDYMIKKVKIRMRKAGGGFIHDSRADVNTLMQVCNELTNKINELIDEVNELKKKSN